MAARAPPRFGDDPLASRRGPEGAEDRHAVRFASKVDQVLLGAADDEQPSPATQAPIQNPDQRESSPVFSKERRLSHFHFEPISLPASRTTSRADSASGKRSPQLEMSSYGFPAVQSPPLTPSGSGGQSDTADKYLHPSADSTTSIPARREQHMITPQHSSSIDEPASDPNLRTTTLRPKEDAKHLRSASGGYTDDRTSSHRKGAFSLGGESASSSAAPSREPSPSRASELYSRPVTPVGDVDGPYAAKNRRQQRPAAPKRSVSPRFRFNNISDSRPSTPAPSTEHKRPLLHPSHKSGPVPTLADTPRPPHSKVSSFATLKRFFKRGTSSDTKTDASPLAPRKKNASTKSLASNSSHDAHPPFADDHTLEARYGKIDRVLGSGAGGSVMLMKRDDGRAYAVKEFRQRQPRESKKRYTKKITAEFCVASALHHSNIIETMDIVEVKDRWFQVMEFAPYDLFSIVMSGKMTREEVTCSWLQLVSGVTYLHSCGVAHRDLKLDNVVVTNGGIMKIIDFGSAHVFQYPHESGIQYAEGVVGSDPYMAPEVYDINTKAYDPRASDIWSLGIIFCCMTLKRFPWRIPSATQDKSFRLFSSLPSVGHDPKRLLFHAKSEEAEMPDSTRDGSASADRGRPSGLSAQQRSQSQGAMVQEKREVISGPWRILRQLPRESRHIIWRMLDLDPKKRSKMEEVIQEPWVADTMICRELESGQVIHAPGHKHTLIGPTPAAAPTPDSGGKKAP
ncbi:related to protein kinase NPR1 [Cephalotrichum gorgonifer]|uniref:non-specific serine/threonine protein kinase n=1 Tax=Cephalotrichum gorgonifer TaxID=2041049 RepID=A0AAE8N5D9_9PEZI|nr:related to protein kinase NPR1 [Cephalotrichum gorgonifer]